MELLFVYGTLLDPQVQRTVIGREIDGTPDILVGYTKSTITINSRVYPILLLEKGSIISGKTLKVLTLELEKIDVYETNAYRRIKVSLKSGNQAWVYVR